MIPFDFTVRTMDEVLKRYSHIKNAESLVTNKYCARLISKYRAEFKRREIDFSRTHRLTKAIKEKVDREANAIGLYHFLWAVDHITDQLVTYGRKPESIVTVIEKMKKYGYDPFSLTDDTVHEYFEKNRVRVNKLPSMKARAPAGEYDEYDEDY